MSTADTLSAIYDNLKTIIGGIVDVNTSREVMNAFRDDSADVKLGGPIAVVLYAGSEFDNSLGYRPKYDTGAFPVIIKFSEPDVSAALKKQMQIIHDIKAAVTVDALNVGELAVAKHISRIEALPPDIRYMPPKNIIQMVFNIRYRETQ